MIYQERSSTLRATASFLVRLFLAVLALVSVPAGTVHADTPVDGDQTGDAQLSDDTDPPIVTTNLSDGQVLTGTVPVIETIYETNPQEYAIKVTNTDGTEVMVNGVPVGVIQNPASGTELRYDWDTTTVANGSYQVVLSAIDQSENSQTLPVQVTVNNQPTPPAYPPITAELTPIPPQVVAPPRSMQPKKVTPPADGPPPTNVLGDKTNSDKPAQRLQNIAATIPEVPALATRTCATFFGLCWYYSVPATLVMSAAVIGFYRFHNRVGARIN